MAQQRVVLHVGTPKSGTTYLQDQLWSSREELSAAGVLYPGDSPASHFHAAVELGDGNFHGHVEPEFDGAWSRLVEAARAHPGTTVISHELLGDLSAEKAARALGDLDFAEVHVVMTARDLGRQLPSVWQEEVKNRHHLPLLDFLDVVRPGSTRPDVLRPGPGRLEGYRETFWLRQDLPAVLRRWGADLPASQVHLVTVPAAGQAPSALWDRFAAVVGIDPAAVTPLTGTRNASMGLAETELLRQLNERLDYGLEWPVYGPTITHHLALTALADRPRAVRLELPEADRSWVAARAEAMIAELVALGCTVTGNLADLGVPEAVAREPHPVAIEELLDAALAAIIGLLPSNPAPVHVDVVPADRVDPQSVGRDLVNAAPAGSSPLPSPRASEENRTHLGPDVSRQVVAGTADAGLRRLAQVRRAWRRYKPRRPAPVRTDRAATGGHDSLQTGSLVHA